MRRSVCTSVVTASALALAASLLAGCEDGPNQTYSPANGTLFNNGDNDGSVNGGSYALDAGYAGTSALAVCTQDLKRARWAKMLTDDIVPPRSYAGLDMAGGDTWQGLKIEAASQPPDPVKLEGGNCQGNALANANCGSGNGNCGNVAWGDNNEVQFSYNLATHVVDQMQLNLGYTGLMKMQDRAKKHSYTIAVGLPPTKDGKTFLVPWNNSDCKADPNNPCYDEVITELFNAAMNTFAGAAGIPWPTDSTSCLKDRNCLQYPNDGAGNTILGFRPLAVYFLGTQHAGLPQPVASEPSFLYNFYTKLEPYSKAPETLKIDAVGPFASMPVGDNGKTCSIQIGQTYQNFLDNCINVYKDPSLNTLDSNKLVGGRSHDYENILFNVVGVNQNFSLTPDLMTFQVVQDTDLPKPADFSTDWYFDVRASAGVKNEAGILLGTGLVEREYARLAELDINRLTGGTHYIGDPACINAPYAAKCTGLESMIVPGTDGGSYPSGGRYATDPPGLQVGLTNNSSGVLSPGDPTSVFLDAAGQQAYGAFWDNSLQQVVRVLGNGDILTLPEPVRDRRYFFRWFGIANIKYLKAYARCGQTCTPTDIANQPVDLESLFFDNNYLNQFDKFEYIDRSLVQNPPPQGQEYLGVPLDYEYGTDVKAGNQRYTNFYRRLDREENAMFTAMNVTKSDLPGQENNINLTNMFGSPVLANAWPSYQCATEMWSAHHAVNAADYAAGGACHGAPPPPLDANGNTLMDLNGQMAVQDAAHAGAYPNAKPLLAYYPAAWGQTVFSKGHSPIKVTQGDRLVEGAHIVLPNFKNPYLACAVKGLDPAGNACDPNDPTYASPIQALVPWAPNQPGNGFFLPTDSQTNKLVQAGELQFEGVLETYDVFYEPFADIAQTDCSGGQTCNAGYGCQSGVCVATDQTVRIAAIYANDFLGEVFVCQDPATSDLLHVRMYTSTFDVLNWIAQHPGDPAAQVPAAQDACNMFIRYSPYDNYPDQIVSLGNGVWLNSNQGQGFGRIVDAELFDTNFENQ